MSACLSCKGLGCSACQTYTVGRLTFDFSNRESSTFDPPSLSDAIARVIERTKAEPDFRSRETM